MEGPSTCFVGRDLGIAACLQLLGPHAAACLPAQPRALRALLASQASAASTMLGHAAPLQALPHESETEGAASVQVGREPVVGDVLELALPRKHAVLVGQRHPVLPVGRVLLLALSDLPL
jgi:hypothetical protein